MRLMESAARDCEIATMECASWDREIAAAEGAGGQMVVGANDNAVVHGIAFFLLNIWVDFD